MIFAKTLVILSIIVLLFPLRGVALGQLPSFSTGAYSRTKPVAITEQPKRKRKQRPVRNLNKF